ncbi:FKBP-type peptidyl-prolyl cis-trans isomerase [Carboxylicivirga sp. RSCT41]|uniref:FKBP-type peptidyl-prolyl cis-trans isomerase n=1 Tax=Carboxylicivirga agarovorans TaxID=3417570 RepID=UPI003D335ED6
MRKILLFAMLLPLLAGCLNDDDYVDYAALDEELISEYLAANNIEAERHSSGLYYKVINPGIGDPIGDEDNTDTKVTFSFNSKTINGKDFYENDKNHTAYLSTLPYGFQIGLSQINKQGEIILYTPSQLCRDAYGYIYGEENTVMIYHINTLRDQSEIDEDILADYLAENQIEAVRDESGLYYEIIVDGEGENVPDEALIDVSYKGTFLDGEVFDERTLSGASLSNLIEAWKVGVPLLKKGSKAKFYCPSQMCYGSSDRYDGNGKVTVPGNSILIFEIEVVNFR